MDLIKSLEILEALASGYSPITGELLSDENVINERDVIRALQLAIDELKKHNPQIMESSIEIDGNEIRYVTQLFENKGTQATPNRLVSFFLGTRRFRDKSISSDKLFGKYDNSYSKGQLLDYFTQLLSKNSSEKRSNAWDDVDFFQENFFNTFSEKDISQLKEKIAVLGVQKTDDLSESVVNARINYPRAYELWSLEEKQLLKEAIKKTNDLNFLSECFQRGKGSIESYGKKIIYESNHLS